MRVEGPAVGWRGNVLKQAGITTMRLRVELIEELVQEGGGYGLRAGCADGDSGAALVLRVN